MRYDGQTYPYNYFNMSGKQVRHAATFSQRLKAYRKKAGLTQRGFSEMVEKYSGCRDNGTKFTQGDISNYERGKCCPKIDKLTALAHGTGIPAYWWAGYELKAASLAA